MGVWDKIKAWWNKDEKENEWGQVTERLDEDRQQQAANDNDSNDGGSDD